MKDDARFKESVALSGGFQQSLAHEFSSQSVIAAVDPVENAITLWAESSTRAETRDRDERLRDKRLIVRSFLRYVGKPPADVGPNSIEAEAERGSIHALRDYAVTLFYLYSGLRRNEFFGLRGSNIELQADGMIIRYKRKGGKYQRREVGHPDVRDALVAYLKKIGEALPPLRRADPRPQTLSEPVSLAQISPGFFRSRVQWLS